ncbi:MAG: hypothetical protein U0T36_03425 [Saprospiraceae bacterium]
MSNNGMNIAIRQDNTTAYPFTADPSRFIHCYNRMSQVATYAINASSDDLKYLTVGRQA